MVTATQDISAFEKKATAFNQLIASGVSLTDALVQANITADEQINFEFVDGVMQAIGVVNPNIANYLADRVTDVLPGAANARQQQTVTNQLMGGAAENDWRVRLSLANGSRDLYNDTTGGGSTGILAPLVPTNGVIFPYTPAIQTTYGANYSSYDLTHSNFRGYFYQNSYVDEIQIQATFTAQDTAEANYMLAVIHFLKSASKMFYGQDPNRGVPPPMLFLSGLGEYQFNSHPTLLRTFNYNLPADVDYIRANAVTNNGTSLNIFAQGRSSGGYTDTYAENRLRAAGVPYGAIQGFRVATNQYINNGGNEPTYVPTKIDIQLSLLPIQTRKQISRDFSLRGYANGSLLKGGFW